MKEFIARIGLDRFAHLGIGGLLCAMLTDFFANVCGIAGWRTMLCGIIAAVAVLAVSVYKEYRIDDGADWLDIAAAMIGCALYLASLAAGLALHGASL